MKYLVLLLSLVISSVVVAEEYNHGNHNDPYIQFFNGTETFNCGSLSFYACASQTNIQSMANHLLSPGRQPRSLVGSEIFHPGKFQTTIDRDGPSA